MKFNTRLVVTFITIIILPIILAIVAYLIIGASVVYNIRDNFGLDSMNISFASDPDSAIEAINDDYYQLLKEKALNSPKELEDLDMLVQVDNQLNEVSSFLVVRKGNEIYYASEAVKSDAFLQRLPQYGSETEDEEIGYYFNDQQKLVKQIDFRFEDGAYGTIYLITRVNLMVSETLVSNMFVAMILVLILTSILLTTWIRQSIYRPVESLKVAMRQIADGNLDVSVHTDEKGEMGALYDNFEQMRMKLKESAEEKIENEKMNRELVSNISHDLKTPITSIKGYVEGIMDGIADSPEKIDKYIKTIYNKANDMDRLINELTMYSQIDANKIPYHFHNISVKDYFDDCVEEVGLDLESRGICFTYENLLEEETLIIADPEQLKRVINNIINNSVKYRRKDNPYIEIRLTDINDFVLVEIEDNGKGIPKEDLSKIFERFYRTDSSRNSAQGGSGIGLSIAKKIVEDHGGKIWATGDEGKGICIHLTLQKYFEQLEVLPDEDSSENNPIRKIEKMITNTAKGIMSEAEKKVNSVEWNRNVKKDSEKGGKNLDEKNINN